MSIVAASADRDEWLAWRRAGAGASDIAAILGLSRWGSQFAVWADKVGLVSSDEQLDDDDPREFGRRAEAMIAPWFADKTGLNVVATQLWAVHDELTWARATPDGAVTDDGARCRGNSSCPYPGHPDRSHGFELPRTVDDIRRAVDLGRLVEGLEIKVDYGSPWYDGLPIYYKTQGQWQMACTGWERVWFAVLHGRRFRVYELERNDEDIEFMLDRVNGFWNDYVLSGTPPPVDDSDATATALKRMYPGVQPGKQAILTHIKNELESLAEAKERIKQATADEKRAKAEIALAMEDAEIGIVDGVQALTYKPQVRRSTCKHCLAVDESEPFRVLRITKGDK